MKTVKRKKLTKKQAAKAIVAIYKRALKDIEWTLNAADVWYGTEPWKMMIDVGGGKYVPDRNRNGEAILADDPYPDDGLDSWLWSREEIQNECDIQNMCNSVAKARGAKRNRWK